MRGLVTSPARKAKMKIKVEIEKCNAVVNMILKTGPEIDIFCGSVREGKQVLCNECKAKRGA